MRGHLKFGRFMQIFCFIVVGSMIFSVILPENIANGARLDPNSDPIEPIFILNFPFIRNPYNYALEPSYSLQWNMQAIRANTAWDNEIGGGPLMPVAILDTSIDLDHQDLVENILPGIDCLAVDSNLNCTSLSPVDQSDGHGTHVAGIVAAALNHKGVLGVAPFASIYPVRVLDDNGSGDSLSAARGIKWAVEHARIINMSFGGSTYDGIFAGVVDDAIKNRGAILIAAAGNGATSAPSYPAAYNGVIGVGATDQANKLASFSNFGAPVDVTAPGIDIYSTFTGNSYAYLRGTSMAAPHVSGLAALIWSLHPEYTAAQVVDTIQASGGRKTRESKDGFGLIQVDKALGITTPPSLTPLPESPTISSQSLQEDRTAAVVPGKVLVKIKNGYLPMGILSSQSPALADATVEGEVASLGIQVVSVAAGQEWPAVDALRALPGVEYAQPDYIYTAY